MNPWRGLRGLPRGVWLVCAGVLINRAGTMVTPFLALYLTQARGFSATAAGFTLTLYGLGSFVTSPYWGRLSDRIGPLPVMKGSLFASGALMLGFPMLGGAAAIMVAAFVLGVVIDAFRPASLLILSDLAPPGQLRAAYALNRLAVNVGMSIGPAAGGFIAMVSFPTLFWVDGLTSILAGLFLGAASLGPLPARSSATGGPPRERRWPLDGRLLLFLAAMILALMIFFQALSSLPLFVVRDLGIPEYGYGLLLAINTLLIILLEVPLNLAMAGWPHGRALALGAFLTGVGFGATALAGGAMGVAATVVIWTFGEMILFPTGSAYAAEIAPADRRGLYLGLFTMTFSAANALGPWLGMAVYEQYGGGVLWSAAFACGCISAIGMAALPRIVEPATV